MANETNSAPTALSTNIFTRSGYTFSGWNTAANGTGTAYADGAIFPFSASATLYAQWSAAVTSFTVTFNGNTSTSGTMANETSSAPTALSTNTFTKIGLHLHRLEHRRQRHRHRPTPTPPVYPLQPPAPPSSPSGARQSLVTPSPLTATPPPVERWLTETSSAPTTLTPNSFAKTGYTFSGWNTAANGTGTAYADAAIFPFSTSATLFAQWSANLSASPSPSTATPPPVDPHGRMRPASRTTALTPNSFAKTGLHLQRLEHRR